MHKMQAPDFIATVNRHWITLTNDIPKCWLSLSEPSSLWTGNTQITVDTNFQATLEEAWLNHVSTENTRKPTAVKDQVSQP